MNRKAYSPKNLPLRIRMGLWIAACLDVKKKAVTVEDGNVVVYDSNGAPCKYFDKLYATVETRVNRHLEEEIAPLEERALMLSDSTRQHNQAQLKSVEAKMQVIIKRYEVYKEEAKADVALRSEKYENYVRRRLIKEGKKNGKEK